MERAERSSQNERYQQCREHEPDNEWFDAGAPADTAPSHQVNEDRYDPDQRIGDNRRKFRKHSIDLTGLIRFEGTDYADLGRLANARNVTATSLASLEAPL